MSGNKSEHILAILLLFSLSFGCTIAVFAPEASEYGRPMLCKNRDVPNYRQQYIYVEAEHAFVGITYQEVYNKIYSGVNDAGFGIVNTDTYNHGPNFPSGLSDGEVMFLALSQCETVWDFASLLDSLYADTSAGIRSTHCYGVIDMHGNAGIFEASCTSFAYFSANSAEDKYLVRTNFAIVGLGDDRRGYDRYMRARALYDTLAVLSVYEIISVMSDLVTEELNPNPLPFDSTFDSLPYGYISTENTINRFLTTSYQVIIGSNSYDGYEYPVVWGGFGQPYFNVAFPLWVDAGSVPLEVTDSDNYLCSESRFAWQQVYDCGPITMMNTFDAQSIFEYFKPLMETVGVFYEESQIIWSKEPANIEDLTATQDSIVRLITASYEDLHGLLVREQPSKLPSEIMIRGYPNPFNSSVTLDMNIPFDSVAELAIFNIAGHMLDSREYSWGEHKFVWTPEQNLPSGIYLAILRSGNEKVKTRLMLVR